MPKFKPITLVDTCISLLAFKGGTCTHGTYSKISLIGLNVEEKNMDSPFLHEYHYE